VREAIPTNPALASLGPHPAFSPSVFHDCSLCARCTRTSPSQRRPSFAWAPRLTCVAGHSHPAHTPPDLWPVARCSASSLTAFSLPAPHLRADVNRDCAPLRPAFVGRSALLREPVDAQLASTPPHQHCALGCQRPCLGQRFLTFSLF
jgi:hypothetical protein